MQTTPLDITSDAIRQKGFVLKREGDTLVLHFNGLEARSSIYKKDWNKTVEKAVKKFAEDLQQKSLDKLTLQEVKSAMSANYDVIMNGKIAANAAAISKVVNHRGPRMLPKAVPADCSFEQWQSIVQKKRENLKNTAEREIPGLWLPLEFV